MTKNILSVTAFLALLAVLPLPYVYYEWLRIIVFCVAIWTSILFYRSKLSSWSFVFSSLAILFNPIFPVHLSRTAWAPIDLITATLFVLAAKSIRRKKSFF